jgi:hypothetical protein
VDKLPIHLPDDEDTYVGEVMRPFLNTIIKPAYSFTARPRSNNGRIVRHEKAELILASGEVLPVTVIGSGRVHPTPQAVQSGDWKAGDMPIFIQASDLNEEQAQQARWIVQRQKTGA